MMEEALKKAEDVVLEAIRRGKYEEAGKIVFRDVFKPLLDLIFHIEKEVDRNTENIARLTEKVDKNTENIAKLTEKVDKNTENIDKLTENVKKLLGETGRLRGRDVEFRTGLMLQGWFRKNAPDYEVFIWDGTEADILIEGRGILASIDIAIKPKIEDVRQLKNGIGVIEENWGKKPDLLIIYSRSGIIPRKVADLADRMGVKIVRKPAEIRKILDESK
jgi:seryl-tRNA synthetase